MRFLLAMIQQLISVLECEMKSGLLLFDEIDVPLNNEMLLFKINLQLR